MLRIRLGYREEQQQQAKEDRRIVGENDDTGQQGQMPEHQRTRHTWRRIVHGRERQRAEFASEQQGQHAGVEDHRNGRAPAEVAHHEADVPAPGVRDHQHRRGRVGRHHAADGNVHEQHAERSVFQAIADRLRVVAVAQDQRRQGHRRRFGDEGTEQRHQAQRDEEIGRALRHRQQARQQRHQAARHLQHGAARGHHHDREHEQRLGEVQPIDVVQGRRLALHRDKGTEQHHCPEAEYHLDFTEQVEDAGVRGFHMRQVIEEFGGERVQHGECEQPGTDPFHRHRRLPPSCEGRILASMPQLPAGSRRRSR